VTVAAFYAAHVIAGRAVVLGTHAAPLRWIVRYVTDHGTSVYLLCSRDEVGIVELRAEAEMPAQQPIARRPTWGWAQTHRGVA
jgi:hypothetical protein